MNNESPRNLGLDEDAIAWNLIEIVTLMQLHDGMDPEKLLGAVNGSLERTDTHALVLALAGHASILARLYARASGKPVIEVLEEQSDIGTLARLDVESDDQS